MNLVSESHSGAVISATPGHCEARQRRGNPVAGGKIAAPLRGSQ